MSRFPGEPGLSRTPQLSSSTHSGTESFTYVLDLLENWHRFFHGLNALPVIQPTVSKYWWKSSTCCCQVHLWAVCLQPSSSSVISRVQSLQPPPAWTVGSCWQYVTSFGICQKGTLVAQRPHLFQDAQWPWLVQKRFSRVTGQLPDMPTRGLVNSWTGQVTDTNYVDTK